jgi:hypothetical protein
LTQPATRAGGDEVDDLAREDRADGLLRFARRAPEVRREDELGMRRSGESAGSGSVAKVSSAAPPRWPSSSRRSSAASSTSPPRAALMRYAPVLHRAQARFGQQVRRFLRARDVQRDDVGPREQLVERLQRHAALARGRRRQERIVGGHFHADALRLARDRAADAAEADDAELLAFEFEAGEAGLGPLPAFMPASARGMWRASANSSDSACSAAASVLPSGAFITAMPLAVAASTSMVSTPRPRGRSRAGARVFERRGGTWRGGRTSKASTSAMRGGELVGVLDGSEMATSQPARRNNCEAVFMDAIAGQHFHSHAPR